MFSCVVQSARILALALIAFAVAASGLANAQNVASTRIGSAALIDPASANAFYGNSTTSTNGLGQAQRPDEIRELARGLRNDPDLIFDFVRNTIDIEWGYGLRKGALGALVDRSGTAFDQAQLMVELLREAGFSASYQAGTITLSGQDFYNWSGLANATAACQLMANAGIPAAINGATLSNCAYGNVGVTSVTLSHIWVSAAIGGGTFVFDPSFKTYQHVTGLNLPSLMGMSPGQVLADASAGMGTGTTAGVSFVRGLNANGLGARLQSYGANLLGHLSSNTQGAFLEDIIGGRRLQRFEIPTGGLRQTSLPYPTNVQRTWSGGIPDQYRTTLRVRLDRMQTDGSLLQLFDRTLFVDEIGGRRLTIQPNWVRSATNRNGTYSVALQIANNSGTRLTVANYTSSNDVVMLRKGNIYLTANHPYAASADGTTQTSGAYMDRDIAKSVYFFLPLTVVNAWGDSNASLVEAWGTRRDTPLQPAVIPGCDTCGGGFLQSAGDARREQLAASWMAQASIASRMHAAIAGAVYVHHHSLGIVSAETRVTGQVPPQSSVAYYNVGDSYDRIDVEDSFSLVSSAANVIDRRAAIFAIAATRDALEASVVAQVADLPDTTSTATRFEWGNAPPSGEDFSNGYGSRRVYGYDSTNASQASNISVAEGLTSSSQTGVHPCQGEPILSSSEVASRRGRLANAIQQYTAAGFAVAASEEAFLGPGQRSGPFREDASACRHAGSYQRGGAFVAVRSVNGEPVEIAHIVVGLDNDAKGGGGGVQTSQQAQYNPSTAADILRTRFVDRSEAVGVDLRNGSVTYAAPGQVTAGAGEFPYQLTGQLIWRGGREPAFMLGPQVLTQPQAPWTTNWHNVLTVSSSGLEAMGETDIRAAAATIAAFAAQQDVYRANDSLQREVAGLLVSGWWLRQIAGNVVTANVGADTRQFIRDVNGQWFSPGSTAFATLTQTGARTVGTEPPACSGVSTITYSPTRGWLYDNVSFQVRNANGDVQSFGYWEAPYLDPGGSCANLSGFRMSNWTFPQGVQVNFVYSASANGDGRALLTEVNNNLGRRIRFSYDLTYSLLTSIDNGLAGGDIRRLNVAYNAADNQVASVTDSAGAQTRFSTSIVDETYLLTDVFDADDTTAPSLRYSYDSLERMREARDAVALQGSRGPHIFRIAPGHRGEREDPAGGRYEVFYTRDGQPFRFINELGLATSATYDGRGRVTAYIYPESDQELLSYDGRNRVTQMTRVAKPGSGLSNLVVSASWNDTWNKPASVTDARGYRTDLTYVASGLGAGEIATATRPAPTGPTPIGSGNRPVYSFTYGAFGQVATSTDPTGLMTLNAYNTANGLLQSTSINPGGVNATTTFGYDPQGDVVLTTDPRGNATATAYDAMRRPTTVLRYSGGAGTPVIAADRTTYNVLGQATLIEAGTSFSGGSVTAWQTREARTYTPTGQVATARDALNNTTTTAYDGLDRVLQVADPIGRITRNEYDSAGQLTRVMRAYGTPIQIDYARYTYTSNGQRLSVIDANNNRTDYTYDGFDRLIRQNFPSATLGALTSNPNDFEGYGYDANGNRTSLRLRSGETISYGFDNLSRETLRDIPNTAASDVYTTYDLAGRRLSARFETAAGQGIAYVYDGMGRLSSETSFDRTLSYQYDAASNRTRLTHPDGFFVDYTYDALNRMRAVLENGATVGAGVLAVYDYDPLSRRTSVSRAGGGGAATSYGYDAASRLTGLTQDFVGTAADLAITMAYTPASQLSQRTLSNLSYAWTPTTATRSYNRNGLNQYTAVSGLAFVYDGRGNLTSDGSRSFEYDLENRLTSVVGGGIAGLGLHYDPLGRLSWVASGSPAAVTSFLYDGDALVAEYDGSGSLLRRYVHGPGVDEPVVWYEGAGLSDRRWFQTDHQGSIIATSASLGQQTGTYAYGPYGEPANDNWTGARFRYTGQIALPEARLYHYKARVYDPNLGRFLQTDPVGYEDDLNLYAYVGNDPINLVDPTGQTRRRTPLEEFRRQQSEQSSRAMRRDPARSAPLRADGTPFPTVSRDAVAQSLAQPGRNGEPARTAVYADPSGRGPLVPAETATQTLVAPQGYVRVELIGTPQVTRSGGRETGHGPSSLDSGLMLARSGRYSEVHFNRTLSSCSGGCIQSGLRGDVTGVLRTDRSLDVFEVLSPGQTLGARQQQMSPFVPPERVQGAPY